MAAAKQLDDITECPICTEVYTDPRSLPCLHTYCLKCLETYCKDKQPGDELACPMCRKEFTLPSNGVSDVPKNFSVGKFLLAKELWSVESKTSACEACSGNEVTEKKAATDTISTTLRKLRLGIKKPAVKQKVPKLTHVIPSQGRDKVWAVTSLGDDVFVVRDYSKQVEVYDAETFTLQRHITVPGLASWPSGLAACAVNHCIYASDWNMSSIHRVELSVSTSSAVKKWSVGRRPTGLSVNKAHNLVVTCSDANKLQEYTTHGSLVREICLQAGVTRPHHAIQLSTGHYVVSQDTSPGVVSVVGVDGQVMHSYGQSQTSDVGQMLYPTSLTVTKNDDILVADEVNNRILSIIRSTGCVQELALSVDGGIQYPRGLCLDESRGRLYVGEWSGQCRVLVFDDVMICPFP